MSNIHVTPEDLMNAKAMVDTVHQGITETFPVAQAAIEGMNVEGEWAVAFNTMFENAAPHVPALAEQLEGIGLTLQQILDAFESLDGDLSANIGGT